jgi:mono/diheme cytochrome c family protein
MKTPVVRLLLVSLLAGMPFFSGASTGEEVWMKNCRKCHGEDGKGDTAIGKKFSIRDYTNAAVLDGLTDEAIKAAIVHGIKNGDGKKVMLAFGDKIREEDIAAVTAYLRSLKAE